MRAGPRVASASPSDLRQPAGSIRQVSTAAPGARFTFGWCRKMRAADEFASVFRYRCSQGRGGLDVLAAPNGLPHARLGMIVPRKVIATAVARNRVKRLLRETFRLYQHEVAGLDVVARVRGRLTDVDLSRTFLASLRKCASCVHGREASAATTQGPSTEPL